MKKKRGFAKDAVGMSYRGARLDELKPLPKRVIAAWKRAKRRKS